MGQAAEGSAGAGERKGGGLRTVAGVLTFLTMFLSAMLAMWWPPYLIDRVLSVDETVAMELPLVKRWPDRYRSPWEYRFTAEGREFVGTPFMSEDGVIWDYEAETVRAVVVRSVTRPEYHRIEPVFELGGFPLVRLFPYWLVLCVGVVFVVVLLSSWEHLVRFARGTTDPVTDGGIIAVNLAAAPILIAMPFCVFGAAAAFTSDYAFLHGWGLPLVAAAVGLCVLFVVLGLIGRQLEARAKSRAEQSREQPGPVQFL